METTTVLFWEIVLKKYFLTTTTGLRQCSRGKKCDAQRSVNSFRAPRCAPSVDTAFTEVDIQVKRSSASPSQNYDAVCVRNTSCPCLLLWTVCEPTVTSRLSWILGHTRVQRSHLIYIWFSTTESGPNILLMCWGCLCSSHCHKVCKGQRFKCCVSSCLSDVISFDINMI